MQDVFFNSNILKNLEKLHFKVRKNILGKKQGIHSSFRKGSGLEFSDYTPYSLGDNPKNIDWNVYAKTEKLYIKEFKEYQNINFFIYLDTSFSMETPSVNSKLKKALELTSALSFIALTNNENLTIATSSNFLLNKVTSKKSFHLILNSLKNIKTSSDDFFNQNLDSYLNKIKFPGIAVCISDFLTPFNKIKQGLDKILSKNLEIFLIRVHDEDFLQYYENKNAKFIDSETLEERTLSLTSDNLKTYIKNYNNHLEMINKYAKKYDIKIYTLNKNDDILTFLKNSSLCY